jgi:actin-like ATPase involved in cell morphogenesis
VSRPYCLGIDLGTTSVAAALSYGDQPSMIALGRRSVVMPSMAFLDEDGRILCGEAAQQRSRTHPERAASGFKRRLGDPTPMRLGKHARSAAELLPELLAEVLKEVVEVEGSSPQSVVLTHPATWGPLRLGMLVDIARRAGVQETITVSEPIAAAVHYAARHKLTDSQLLAVYDLGGGTFDVTVLRAHGRRVEILGEPEGVERLGGLDFDEALFRHLDHRCDGALSEPDPSDPAVRAALAQIRLDCAMAKERLSRDKRTVVPVFLPERHFEVGVTREQFEDLIRVQIESTIGALERTVRSAGVSPDALDAVLLVGGGSRIPLVSRMLTERLGRPVAVDVHPKYAVALGAATLAATPAAVARPPASKLAHPTPQPAADSGRPATAERESTEELASAMPAVPRQSGTVARLAAAAATAAALAGLAVHVVFGVQPTPTAVAEPATATATGTCGQDNCDPGEPASGAGPDGVNKPDSDAAGCEPGQGGTAGCAAAIPTPRRTVTSRAAKRPAAVRPTPRPTQVRAKTVTVSTSDNKSSKNKIDSSKSQPRSSTKR